MRDDTFEDWIADMDGRIAPNHHVSLERMNDRYEAIDVELAHQAWNAAHQTMCTLGVGDGSGAYFVYGEYEPVKECQRKLLELEQLRQRNDGLVDEIAELRHVVDRLVEASEHTIDDLRMRARTADDGVKEVNLSDWIWRMLNDAVAYANDRRVP